MLGVGKVMLAAAIPDRELPWFALDVDRRTGTKVRLEIVANKRPVIYERSRPEDVSTVRELLGMWPEIVDQFPSVALKVLSFVPLPKVLRVQGAPVRSESTPDKERARLSMSAQVLGRTIDYHWDSSLDRLYMKDLLQGLDFLKDLQAAAGKPNG